MGKSPNETPLRDRLLEFVQEDNGSFSATRLAFLLWVIGVLVIWIIECLRLNDLQPVSADIATILGILMTGKVVQKFGEKPGSDQDGSGQEKVAGADVPTPSRTSQRPLSSDRPLRRLSVQLHSDGSEGATQTITITQTGTDTAHIDVVGGEVPSEDVINVRADPTALTLTCQVHVLFQTGNVSVAVKRPADGNPPVATITISGLLFGNGPHVFPLQTGEDNALQTFLQQAGFPPLPAGGV